MGGVGESGRAEYGGLGGEGERRSQPVPEGKVLLLSLLFFWWGTVLWNGFQE